MNKEEVLSRLTPQDIYSGLLQKSTKGFKAICPFHGEKTPSLHIYSDDLSFYCFGCGKGGSAVDFVMETEGLGFREAFTLLASKAGVEVSIRTGKYERLYSINKEAQRYYSESLKGNKDAFKYLSEVRGVNEESIERFRLGYAGDSPISEVLKGIGYKEDEIVGAGIAVRRYGTISDVFRKRIVFPIQHRGRVRGFGGRLIEEGEPKYLNSPSTPLFEKKKLLYGLDIAAPEINKKGFAIIVEGYFDVIRAYQCGYRNTVAPLGTSLTEYHIETIQDYCDRVILIFDGDNGGKIGAERSVKLLFDKGIKGSAVVLPEGEDPDSFLRKGGDLNCLIKDSVPFSVFLVQRFPGTRKMMFNALLKRKREEIVEFLGYMGEKEEVDSFKELGARYLVDNIISRSPVISQKNGLSVKKHGDFLVLLSKGSFLFWNKARGNYNDQAEEMINKVVALRVNHPMSEDRGLRSLMF